MSRKDAIRKLHTQLMEQRNSLMHQIEDDMGLAQTVSDSGSDLGETASLVEQSELHTQLADLESREVSLIDHAIERIRQGKYGICEDCQKPIPVARLQMLPFTTCCVNCQRHQEDEEDAEYHGSPNWGHVLEYERRNNTREISLGDLEH